MERPAGLASVLHAALPCCYFAAFLLGKFFETEDLGQIWRDFDCQLQQQQEKLKQQQEQQKQQQQQQQERTPRKRLRPERLLLQFAFDCEHPEAERVFKAHADICGACGQELSRAFVFEDHGQYTKFTEYVDERELKRQKQEQRQLLQARKAAHLSQLINENRDECSLAVASTSMSAGHDVPDLWAAMKPHQKDGMEFLLGLLKDGHGGVLAHDMGLGKSLTTIATLLKLSEDTSQLLRCVLVAPTNPLFHWKLEFSKWLQRLPTGRVIQVWLSSEKQPLERAQRLVEWCRRAQDKPRQLLVVVVSYDVLTNLLLGSERMHSQGIQEPDIAKLQDWLRCIPDVVIADEGHRLNHKNTRWYEALCQFQTTRRVVLTGHPFRNHLGEYYNLLKWVQPDLVPKTEREFAEKYMFFNNPVLLSASKLDSAPSLASLERLHQDTKKHVQRRERTDPNLKPPLPDKFETVLLCQPTAEQRRLQQLVLKAAGDLMQKRTRMERISMHPELAASLAVDAEQPVLVTLKQLECIPELSSKVMALLTLLEWCHVNQEKVVAFSEHVYFLDFIQPLLSKVYANLVFRMDGKTSVEARKECACAFNSTNGFAVFLLSIRACSEGIDLQAARRVAILDPSWNPGWKSQAVARCWRIGQDRTVFVYHFLTGASQGASSQHACINHEEQSLLEVEKLIFQRGLRKEHLFAQAVDARCGAHMDEPVSVNMDPFLAELQAEATLSTIVTAVTPQQFWATYREAEELEQALLQTKEAESPSTPNNRQSIAMAPATASPDLAASSSNCSLSQEQLDLRIEMAPAAASPAHEASSPDGTPSQEPLSLRMDASDVDDATIPDPALEPEPSLPPLLHTATCHAPRTTHYAHGHGWMSHHAPEPEPVLAPQSEAQTSQDAPCASQVEHECLWQGAWWDVCIVRRRLNTVVVKYTNFPGWDEEQVAAEAVRKASVKAESPTDLTVGQRVCCFVHMQRGRDTGIHGKAWYDGVLVEHKTACSACRQAQKSGTQFNYDSCNCRMLVNCWVHGDLKRKSFLVRLHEIAVRE
eukprot:jgi/Chlat1/5150/Chrsp33S05032